MEALKGRWASAAAACILADKMQAVSVCIPEYTDGKYRFPVPACTAEQGCMGSGPARTVFAGCRSRLCSLICYSCTWETSFSFLRSGMVSGRIRSFADGTATDAMDDSCRRSAQVSDRLQQQPSQEVSSIRRIYCYSCGLQLPFPVCPKRSEQVCIGSSDAEMCGSSLYVDDYMYYT